MHRSLRILSCFLALVMIVGFVPVPQADAAGTAVYKGTSYSTDYTAWRQGDPAWGETALGSVHTLGGSGCMVTSIAIQMCNSGAYDPAVFNPGVFRDWLDTKGYISHSSDRSKDALLSFGLMTPTSSPRFYYVNQTFFSTSTSLADVCAQIDELMGKGYYVVARVKNSGHFVAVAKTIGGDAQLYDPGYSSKKLLSEYNGTIGGLIYFKANLSGSDTIVPGSTTTPPKPAEPTPPVSNAPDAPVVTALKSVYGDGDPITVSWKNAARATHYNIYVEQKQADGTWKNNVRVYFYATSPFTIPALGAGEYRVKVQSTNAKDNYSYANAPYEYITVKANSVTVTYNAAGGTLDTSSQLVQKGSTYQLPTPRSGSAFLGWYDAAGKQVTNSSTVTTSAPHTLTAKWSTSGVGIKQSAAYNNSFKDVKASDWFYNSIATVYNYGLMSGISSTEFDPNSTITNAQAITMAARLRKTYLTGNGTFAASSPWYKAYGDYLVSEKVLSSLPKNMDEPITRQEFASIIANALPDAALPAINNVPSGSISDVYRSDAAVYKLYRAGIFTGIDAKGSFNPNAMISRAESATVLVRLADPNSRILF